MLVSDTIDVPRVLYLVFFNDSYDLNNDIFANVHYVVVFDGEREIELNAASYGVMDLMASMLSGSKSNYNIHENNFSRINILHTTPQDIYPELLLKLLIINYF